MGDTSRQVRDMLGHPVLDVDGHVIEFMPAVLPYLRESMGPKLFDKYINQPSPIAKILDADTETRAQQRSPQSAWWGTPAQNTRDLATGAIPGLMYERLDEFGLDYSVLYPTKGFGIAGIADQDLRLGVCRGFNEYYADTYRPYQRPDDGGGCHPDAHSGRGARRARALQEARAEGDRLPRGCHPSDPQAAARPSVAVPVPRPDPLVRLVSASTVRSTTTRCGPRHKSSGSPRCSTAASGTCRPARSPRPPTTPSTTSDRSPSACTRCASRCSWAA